METRGERGRRPRALERHRGHTAAPRHHGVYHYHRHTGWHPHPQYHAARRRLATPVHVDASAPSTPVPLHHHQHVRSDRHLAHARRAAPTLELGQIATYDATSGTATVQLLGSPTRLVGPVAVTAGVPHDVMLVGLACLVVLLDAHNPRDGVVVAVWATIG